MSFCMKEVIILLMSILLIVPTVLAEQGHVPLIAVSSFDDGQRVGTIGDLYLEIRPGDDRVFLDTFPLTKTGTQISMRFAKQIACKYVKKNCDNYDFIYTIRANSGLVTGPSAGAVATMLTIAVLENKELNKHVAMTGTINSGGYIGPVGNVKEKIEAAKNAGLTTILIPKGDRFSETDNQTIDLVQYGNQLSVDVIEVSDIEEAVWYFLGEKQDTEQEVVLDYQYTEVMRTLAEKLCDRTQTLSKDIVNVSVEDTRMRSMQEEIIRLQETSKNVLKDNQAYSAASFCFRANVVASSLLYELQNPTGKAIDEKKAVIESSLKEIEDKIDAKKIETINDLQTFMVVKERLREAKDYLNAIDGQKNDTRAVASLFAFAGERLYAAVTWSEFFSGKSSPFDLDQKRLKESCEQKLSEAEERYNYVQEYFPQLFDARSGIDIAFQDYQNGDMALCLFRATKAKAEINVIINLIGVTDNQVPAVLQQKLKIAKKAIAEQQSEGIFPIVGYSYYEYANALSEYDLSSALLFAEYALELSNLDIYFPKKTNNIDLNPGLVWPFLLGLGAGILITCYLLKPKKEEEA